MKTSMKTKLWTALALLVGANVLMGEWCGPSGTTSLQLTLESVYVTGADHTINGTLLCGGQASKGSVTISASGTGLGLSTTSATSNDQGKFQIKFHPTQSNASYKLSVTGAGSGNCSSTTASYDVLVDEQGEPVFDLSVAAEGDCHYLKGKVTWSANSQPVAGQSCTLVVVGGAGFGVDALVGSATTSTAGEVTSTQVCGSTYKGKSFYLRTYLTVGTETATVESDHFTIP